MLWPRSDEMGTLLAVATTAKFLVPTGARVFRSRNCEALRRDSVMISLLLVLLLRHCRTTLEIVLPYCLECRCSMVHANMRAHVL